MTKKTAKELSPVKILLINVASIFVAESAAMLVLKFYQLPKSYEIIFDSFLLILLLFPVISYFIYVPLRDTINEKERLKKSLGRSKEELNAQINSQLSQIKKSNKKLVKEINERRRAEEELRRNSQFLTTVIDSLDHPFLVIDPENFEIKMANKAAGLIESNTSSKCYNLSHNSEQPCNSLDHPCPVSEVIRLKKPVVVEHTHKEHNGLPTEVEVHAHPIFDTDDSVEAVIEYCLDITQRKRAERALQQATRTAEEINRAKSKFLADASHKLLTQVNNVTSLAELLQDSGPADQRQEQLLNKLQTHSEILKKTGTEIFIGAKPIHKKENDS